MDTPTGMEGIVGELRSFRLESGLCDRAGSGFCQQKTIGWCGAKQLDSVFGFACNEHVCRMIEVSIE